MGRYTDLIDQPPAETQSEPEPDDNPFASSASSSPDGDDVEARWEAQRQACWERFNGTSAIVQATVPAGREWRYRQYGKAAAAVYGPGSSRAYDAKPSQLH